MYKTVRSFTQQKDAFLRERSDLVLETPLEININDERQILIMCTPGMLRELVVGFLFTEGLIKEISDIDDSEIHLHRRENGEEVIEARVRIGIDIYSPAAKESRRISYSSCGVCGKENYYELRDGLARVRSRQRFSMYVLKSFSAKMQFYQPLYRRTGGAHAAILFDREGHPIIHSEDMGRHNALDKVIGASLIKGIGCGDKIAVSSGRASLEMILKTVRAGIPVFVAMSRPTSRAVEAAKFYNVTLVDLAKDSNRIYTHARRIRGF